MCASNQEKNHYTINEYVMKTTTGDDGKVGGFQEKWTPLPVKLSKPIR